MADGDEPLTTLLKRFGADFNRGRKDLGSYYDANFTAIVGDEAVDRSAYLASITAMQEQGIHDIRFDVDLRRTLRPDLFLASGITRVRDVEGTEHGSRFSILCGRDGEGLVFLHVHSSPARAME